MTTTRLEASLFFGKYSSDLCSLNTFHVYLIFHHEAQYFMDIEAYMVFKLKHACITQVTILEYTQEIKGTI